MWFKLAGADFSKNNLGTMSSISSSYLIDYTGLTGMSGSPSSVSYAGSAAGTSKTASVVVTVTSGYTFKQGSTITASGGKSGTVFTADKDYTGGQTFTFSMAITANTKLTGVAEATGGSSSGGGNSGNTPSQPETPPPSGGGTASNFTLVHGNKYSAGYETNVNRASIYPYTIVVPRGVTIKNKSTIQWAYYSNVNVDKLPSGSGIGVWGDYTYTGTGAAIGIAFKKADDSDFDWSVDSNNPADYFDVSDAGLWNGTAQDSGGSSQPETPPVDTPTGTPGDITALTLVDGNPYGTAEQQAAKNRVHSSTALYVPAGTVISCKDTSTYKWALRRVKSETNLSDAGDSNYKPDAAWTTKTSYTTEKNGYWCFILLKASNANFNWGTDSNKVSDYFTVS